MNNGHRLALPNQLPIRHQHSDAPYAHPSAVAVPIGGGITLCVVGGFTKIEAGALQIAANCFHAQPDETFDDIARNAVTLAQAVLTEARRQQATEG